MRFALSAFAIAATLALPQMAHATTMDTFNLTAPDLSLSFSAPSSPTPISTASFYGIIPLYFEIGPLSFVENGATHNLADAYFATTYDVGGFELTDSTGAVIDNLSFVGPQLFSGTLKHPTFLTGTFALTGVQTCDPASLTISAVSSTPEPASLLLLGTGALGAVGALRRRIVR